MKYETGVYATSATKDHFLPKIKGYSLQRNTVLAHQKCNQDKKDRMPNKIEKAQFKKLYQKIDERYEKLKRMKASYASRKKQIESINQKYNKKSNKDKSFGKW